MVDTAGVVSIEMHHTGRDADSRTATPRMHGAPQSKGSYELNARLAVLRPNDTTGALQFARAPRDFKGVSRRHDRRHPGKAGTARGQIFDAALMPTVTVLDRAHVPGALSFPAAHLCTTRRISNPRF
jgi:hypothetical protein